MLSSLSIIGLGKLGAPMTACFAARGFTVHAVDFNPQNSLRPPTVDEPTKTVLVPVQRLDDALAELDVSKVDFIKVDGEGAQLSVLYGVMRLLLRKSRPAILAEVQDVRTLPWGYAAQDIIQFMVRMDYRWFAIAATGALLPISCDQETYNANLVALPAERTEEFLSLLGRR
jgi:hypothetical protein